MTAALARIQSWDSEFFGMKIAHTRDPDMRREAESVWALIDAGDADQLRAFADKGFRHADIRVTLEHDTSSFLVPYHWVGPAVEADREPLAEIARTAHRGSRYYNAGYDPGRCDELYATWMRNSLDGWADSVITTGDEGEPTGYVTVHLDREEAKIGLFAVHANMRGKDLGKSLVSAALERAVMGGAKRVTVVTQGANVPALRLYERSGFKTSSVEIWMHRWVR